MSPASISAFACSTVTPHRLAPSMMAQSSEDGPRSPAGPGWTIKHGHADQMSAGIAVVELALGDDQIRTAATDRVPHRLIAKGELDRHLVTAVGQLDVHPLGHAVVGARKQQNTHPLPPVPSAKGPAPASPRHCPYRARHADPDTPASPATRRTGAAWEGPAPGRRHRHLLGPDPTPSRPDPAAGAVLDPTSGGIDDLGDPAWLRSGHSGSRVPDHIATVHPSAV